MIGQSVPRPSRVVRLEIVIGETQRDAAVVVRAAAENARAEPANSLPRRNGVGLALDVPVAVGREKKVRMAGRLPK